DVPGVHGYRERLGGRQPRPEFAVDQQRPDVSERDLAHQVFDVDTPVPQRATLPVGLGDGGLECDHALESRLEIGHLALPAAAIDCVIDILPSESRPCEETSA